MKKILFAALVFILSGMAAHAQWTRLDLPSGSYRDIFFSAEKTGFLVGDSGMVLKTMDDGVTWRKIDVGVKSNLKSVHFPSANVGYIAGDSVVLKTMDGGESWEVVRDSMFAGYKDIVFTTEEIGYLGKGYFRTVDGGKTWNKQQFDFVRGAHFVSPAIGYVIEEEYLMKTIDSGATWNYVNQVNAGSSAIPSCFHFYDELHGLLGSTFVGRMAYTEDGGQTWETGKIKSAYIGYITDVYSPTRNTGYAIGYITTGPTPTAIGIVKTKDGGKNWIGLKIDTSLHWDIGSQVYFTDENTGYLIDGQVLKTTTGGEEPVSVQEQLLKTISPNISPNPFKNSARIELPENVLCKNCSVKIYDIAGNDVTDNFTFKSSEHTVSIIATTVPVGEYIFTISENEKVLLTGKLLKEAE
ncbi:MAG: YCF48-related protein [Bacteroidota bacterium]